NRNVRVHVQNGLQRLAEAGRPWSAVGQGNFSSGMSNRFLAPEDLAHDGDVVSQPIVGPTPRLPVPPLNNLWSGYAQSGDESPLAGQRVDGRGTHGRIRRCAPGELHHARAQADTFGHRGDIS